MKKRNLVLSAALTVSMIVPAGLNTVFADEYAPGVTVEENTNSTWDADYAATFVYADTDSKDAVAVSVGGSLQFYASDDEVVKNYSSSAVTTGAKVYSAYDYKDGMFNTGYGLNNDSVSYDLVETKDERFEITLPLPGNLYYYDYTVVYGDGSTKTIQDPVNPSPKNEISGHDSGHSLVYVGDENNTTVGQEYAYQRNGQNGIFSYVEYTGEDGTKQPLGVYLPYNYDSSKTYKTLYVSHGGGGNEAEWMGIGALPNIMDNLMGNKEMAEAVVVTMDNTYFGWDYERIAKNFQENIFPYIEENYAVSKAVNDRALCGLSMGALTTGTLMFTHTDMFQYYGCFSGTADPLLCKDMDLLKTKNIYLTGGNVDMAIQATVDAEDSGFNRGKTVRAHEYLTVQGVEHTYDLKNGAHDWGVWRDALTTFGKDCLWDYEFTGASDYKAGATVEENTDKTYDGDYNLTFVYEDTNVKDAVSVSAAGNLQWYKKDDLAVVNYPKTLDYSSAVSYNAYEYKEGMFNTGYGLNNDQATYELSETSAERFEVTLPVPGNLYYYDYTVTYSDGTTETIKDPANMPETSLINSHDAGHSLVYVGNATNTIEGQEYIYPRTDGNIGSCSFVEYLAGDATKQPLGVYLPANYDVNKTYKTIYVSHGGGGNENEWMTIGAVPNIMDNLLAEDKTEEAIVVTMDNTYWQWDMDKIKDNLMNNIIPYVEAHYNVSKEATARAFCGLSMGGLTTTSIYTTLADQFGYLGIWSATNTDLDISTIKNADKPLLFLAAGAVDFGLGGFVGNSEKVGLTDALDAAGISYEYKLSYGAHDWGVWRDLFTTFAKDYLWTKEKPTEQPETTPTVKPAVDVTTKPTTAVKTGDSVSILPVVMTLMLTAGAIAIIIADKKRRFNH